MAQRGRPKLSHSPTKAFIVKAAKLLFYEQGFRKVSVEQICARAGASKMSFYRHFKNKAALGLSILEDFFEKELTWSEKVLNDDCHYQEKLNRLLQRRGQNQKTLGMDFPTELQKATGKNNSVFWEHWSKRVDELNTKFLKAGQKEQVIAKDISPEIFLFFIRKRNELMLDQDLIRICPSFKTRAKIVDDFFYYGISQKQT